MVDSLTPEQRSAVMSRIRRSDTKPEPLEGVPVAEADFSFDRGKLFSANFYLDGKAQRDAILRKLVDKYGTPQSYDQAAGNYSWSWPKNMTIYVRFDAKAGRTAVTYSKDLKLTDADVG